MIIGLRFNQVLIVILKFFCRKEKLITSEVWKKFFTKVFASKVFIKCCSSFFYYIFIKIIIYWLILPYNWFISPVHDLRNLYTDKLSFQNVLVIYWTMVTSSWMVRCTVQMIITRWPIQKGVVAAANMWKEKLSQSWIQCFILIVLAVNDASKKQYFSFSRQHSVYSLYL